MGTVEQISQRGYDVFVLGYSQDLTGHSPEKSGLTLEPLLLWAGVQKKSLWGLFWYEYACDSVPGACYFDWLQSSNSRLLCGSIWCIICTYQYQTEPQLTYLFRVVCTNFLSIFANHNIIEIKTVQLGKSQHKIDHTQKWSCWVESSKTMNIWSLNCSCAVNDT